MAIICPHCKKSFEATDSEYLALVAQVKTTEFEAEVQRRMREISQMQKAEQRSRELQAEKEIERLKGLLGNHEAVKNLELANARAERTKAVSELAAKKDEDIHLRDRTIAELSSRLKAQELAAQKHELELKEQHNILLKAKDEEIERYKDMKSRLSTKMLGETLEQHCLNTFNLARSQGAFRSAYFEKDNDASSGSKGDFIFRDFIGDEECLSIMFEMKNEDDRTATKHRNEDFFAKLDKDRRDKKCEYAVLVTTLEADNELYNTGIVDVSYRYEKMYVIRPQFFISLISLLSQAAKRGAETITALRHELSAARAQSIDVTKFEEKRDRFATDFMKFVEAHKKKHDEAIATIDKAIEDAERQIDKLRKIKALFDTSAQKLERAGEVIENDFTIKKLTHGNPTMKALFDDARRISDTHETTES